MDGFSFFLFHGVLIFKADGVGPTLPSEPLLRRSLLVRGHRKGVSDCPADGFQIASSEQPFHCFPRYVSKILGKRPGKEILGNTPKSSVEG